MGHRTWDTKALPSWAALTLVPALLLGGCRPEQCDLAHKRIGVAVIERYEEGTTQFEYRDSFSAIAGLYPSCGDQTVPAPEFELITTGSALPSNLFCLVSSILDPPMGVDWEFMDRIPPTDEETLESDAHLAWPEHYVFARGQSQPGATCSGVHTLIFRAGQAGHDYVAAPIPSEMPPWLLTWIFEPEGDCPSLALPDDSPACADAWAASFTEIEKR
ncbi:MAG: hypothetical protein ACOC9T_01925 [Myxococcota bacterium]